MELFPFMVLDINIVNVNAGYKVYTYYYLYGIAMHDIICLYEISLVQILKESKERRFLFFCSQRRINIKQCVTVCSLPCQLPLAEPVTPYCKQ